MKNIIGITRNPNFGELVLVFEDGATYSDHYGMGANNIIDHCIKLWSDDAGENINVAVKYSAYPIPVNSTEECKMHLLALDKINIISDHTKSPVDFGNDILAVFKNSLSEEEWENKLREDTPDNAEKIFTEAMSLFEFPNITITKEDFLKGSFDIMNNKIELEKAKIRIKDNAA